MVTISFDEFEMFVELLVEQGRKNLAISVVKKAFDYSDEDAEKYCESCHRGLAIIRQIEKGL